MAARMSELAIDALLDGRDNRIIGYVDGALRALPYKEAKEITYPIQEEQYELVSILSS